MAKLTKAQRKLLLDAVYHLERAQKYLARTDLHIAHERGQATTTLDYVRVKDGAVLCTVAKDIGSDLCGLQDAHMNLRRLMACT